LVAQDYLQQRSNVAVQRAGNSSGVSSKNNGSQSAAAMIRKAGQLQYPANGTIGDWVLRCATPAQCSISQKFSQAPSSAVIVWLELAKNPTNPLAFLATVMTPLGFNLSPPLAFHGDDAVAFRVMVDRCVSSGCIHMASLTRETALGLARHAALRARYVDAQGRALDVMLSTKGLNEALLALDSLANP
jgi:invasion protein IalB